MPPTPVSLAGAVEVARARLEVACPGMGEEARPVAIGWTTVESERAEVELRAVLDDGLGPFLDGREDGALGARCRIATGGPARSLAVLEPSTEGRLAESLARLGEGPNVVWFALDSMPIEGIAGPSDGPFGPEHLLIGGPRDGRHVFLLTGRPGTIAT